VERDFLCFRRSGCGATREFTSRAGDFEAQISGGSGCGRMRWSPMRAAGNSAVIAPRSGPARRKQSPAAEGSGKSFRPVNGIATGRDALENVSAPTASNQRLAELRNAVHPSTRHRMWPFFRFCASSIWESVSRRISPWVWLRAERIQRHAPVRLLRRTWEMSLTEILRGLGPRKMFFLALHREVIDFSFACHARRFFRETVSRRFSRPRNLLREHRGIPGKIEMLPSPAHRKPGGRRDSLANESAGQEQVRITSGRVKRTRRTELLERSARGPQFASWTAGHSCEAVSLPPRKPNVGNP